MVVVQLLGELDGSPVGLVGGLQVDLEGSAAE